MTADRFWSRSKPRSLNDDSCGHMRLCLPPFFQSCIWHSLEQYLAVWHFAQAAKRFEVSSGGSRGSVFGQSRRAHFLAVLAGKAYSKSSSQCQVVSWSAPSTFGVSLCIFAVSSAACSLSDLLLALAMAAAAGVQLAVLLQAVCSDQEQSRRSTGRVRRFGNHPGCS